MSGRLDPIAGQRPRLFGLAYRMLGSAAQAEDAVQEAFARWYAAPRDDVETPAAYLTTVVTHLCLDQLKRASAQRERYPGTWLPEPLPDEAIVDDHGRHEASAEERLERLESISLAFVALLETLTPLERAVFLLHEVFDYPHADVAAIVGRSEAACRQIHRRARRSLALRPRATASPERTRELLGAFLAACQQGDVAALSRLLADDVVSRADGGGLAHAASRPVVGSRAVARLYAGLWRRAPPGTRADVRVVNGWPALVAHAGGVLLSVIQIRSDGDRVEAIDAVVNPEKLVRLAAAWGMRVAMPARDA